MNTGDSERDPKHMAGVEVLGAPGGVLLLRPSAISVTHYLGHQVGVPWVPSPVGGAGGGLRAGAGAQLATSSRTGGQPGIRLPVLHPTHQDSHDALFQISVDPRLVALLCDLHWIGPDGGAECVPQVPQVAVGRKSYITEMQEY